MADDTLQVVISAQSDALKSGMAQAQASVTSAVDSMQTSLTGLQASAQATQFQVNALQDYMASYSGEALQAEISSNALANALSGAGEHAKGASSAFGNIRETVSSSSESIRLGVGALTEFGEALGALYVFDKIKELVTSTTELSEKLTNLSLSTGISVDGLERIRYAAALAGSDFDTVQRSISQLSLKMLELRSGSSNPALETAIADLGLTPEQLADSEHALDNLAAALKRVGINQQSIGDVSEVLGGRGGARLIPVLEKLDEANAKFDAMGLSMGSAVKNADEAQTAFNELDASAERLKDTFGLWAAGSLKDSADEMTTLINATRTADFSTLFDLVTIWKGVPSEAQIQRIKDWWSAARGETSGYAGGTPRGPTFEENLIPAQETEAAPPSTAQRQKSILESVATFKASQEEIVAAAGNTANARVEAETRIVDFIKQQEASLASIPGAQELYLKLETQEAGAASALANATKASAKEALADQLEGARSSATNEESIAQAKYAVLKAQLDQQVQAGIISRQQETTSLQDAANRDYEIKAAAVAKEIAIQESARGGAGPKAITPSWTAADEAQYQKALTDQQTLALANQTKLTEIATAGAAEQMKVAQSTATGEIQIAQARYALLQAQLQQQVQAGIITRQQESADLIDAENRDYASKMQALDNEIAMLPIGTAALQDALNKRFELELAYQTKVTQLQTEAQKGFAFQGVFASVGEDFNSLIDSMLRGTEKVRVEFQNLARSLVEGGIKSSITGLFTGGGGAAGGAKGLGDVIFGGGLSGLLAKLVSPTEGASATASSGGGGTAGSALGSFGLLGSLLSKGSGLLGSFLSPSPPSQEAQIASGAAAGPPSPPSQEAQIASGAAAGPPSPPSQEAQIASGAAAGPPSPTTGGANPAPQDSPGILKLVDSMGTLIGHAGATAAHGAASLAQLILQTALQDITAIASAITASITAEQAAGGFIAKAFEHGGVVPSAYGGMVISAAGGAVNDGKGGQLSILHPREMVLPADLSEGVQRAIRGGTLAGDDGRGGSFTHEEHHHYEIHAMDAQSFHDYITQSKQSGSVATALGVADRNGHPAVRNIGRTSR